MSVSDSCRLCRTCDASGVELWTSAAGHLSDIKQKPNVVPEKTIDEIDERHSLIPDRE